MLTKEDLKRLCKNVGINAEHLFTKRNFAESLNKHYNFEIITESAKSESTFYLSSRKYLEILKDDILTEKYRKTDKNFYEKNKEKKVEYYHANKERLDKYRNEYNKKLTK